MSFMNNAAINDIASAIVERVHLLMDRPGTSTSLPQAAAVNSCISDASTSAYSARIERPTTSSMTTNINVRFAATLNYSVIIACSIFLVFSRQITLNGYDLMVKWLCLRIRNHSLMLQNKYHL